MKYIYLTETTAEQTAMPATGGDIVEQLAFLDLQDFKKIKKNIKKTLDKNADDETDQKIIIIYNSPVSVIASGLRHHIKPQKLVARWIEQADALVKLFRSYPSSCILANASALKADLNKLIKSKKERAIVEAVIKNEASPDIYTLSAHYIIANDENLKHHLLTLDACTAFNEYTEQTCDIQQLLTTIMDCQQQATHATHALQQEQIKAAYLTQQIATLTKQLTTEKETTTAKLSTLQKEFDNQHKNSQNIKTEKDALNDKLKNAQTDLANQAEENEQIIEQLHLVQEAFEESILETNKLKTKNANLEKQIERSESHQSWLVKELLESHKKLNAKSWSYRGLLKKQVAIIKASGLFDEAWYLATYPEVAESKMPPILHYLLYGVIEAKNPSAEFNTKNYLSIYVDVANHGMNPFIHYINFGQSEGRKADPLQKRLPAPKGQ